jgi:hypothetical protein
MPHEAKSNALLFSFCFKEHPKTTKYDLVSNESNKLLCCFLLYLMTFNHASYSVEQDSFILAFLIDLATCLCILYCDNERF